MTKRDMLINSVPGEECRIAIIENGKLEELYHERTSIGSHVGSIFKAKVTNVEPSIQAAFVDFGLERNGFLHVTDLHPRYFPGQHKEETERVGFKTPHRERPPIQKCLKRGQEILVQVIKEGLGTKGPTVTSYLSIPGRFLVMMPAMERLGVSRKVDDDDARRAMRKILDELNPPPEFGFIIRTAGIGRPKTDLKRDLSYLLRLWKNLEKKMAQPGVGELYTESDLMIRTIRDVYSTDIDRIIVDDPDAAKRASDFLAIASPRAKSNVLYYDDPIPLFHRYGVETQIETIHARRVPLPSGGSLVIDSTEALVAIDVNSGKMRNSGDAETTAYRTNVEACDEVCRQLRLRDLGGVVVIDLIDMRAAQKRRAIEQRFRDNLKKDRARTKPLAISQFGILEMTRQRMRPALTKSVYDDCHYCHGEGTVKSIDSVVLEVMRRLSLVVHRKEVAKLAVVVSPDVAFPLLNRKRSELVAMEQKSNTPIQVRVNASGGIDFIELMPMDERGNVLNIDGMKNMAPPVLHPVESMPIEDELIDDEAQTQEMEARATVAERIDDGEEVSDYEIRESRGEPAVEDDHGDETGDDDDAGEERSSEGAAPAGEGTGDGDGVRRKRRRRRRRGRSGKGGEGAEEAAEGTESHGEVGEEAATPAAQPRPQQPKPAQSQSRPLQSKPQGAKPLAAKPQPAKPQSEQRPQPPQSRGYLRADEVASKPPVVIEDNIGNRKDLRDASSDGDHDEHEDHDDHNNRGGRSSDNSDQAGPVQLGPDGQPLKKKRRRRGGRRHRRRREAKMRAEQERLEAGLPPLAPGEGEGADEQGDSESDGRSDQSEDDQANDSSPSDDSVQSSDGSDDADDVRRADDDSDDSDTSTDADDSDDDSDNADDASASASEVKKKTTKPRPKRTTKAATTKKKKVTKAVKDDASSKKTKKKVAKRPSRKAPTRKPPQSQAMEQEVQIEPTE